MAEDIKFLVKFVCQAVEILKDMGFPEEDVIKALKATGNSQRAAVRLKPGL